MNENKLSRVVFNNQSCRLCGAAHAARTRIRMASEQDEEEEQVSGEWRRTRYRHSIGFLGHGRLSHPIACNARATSVSLCARPVAMCMAAAAAARVICGCARRVYVCVCARATISREQGPNKLSLIPTPLRTDSVAAGTDTKCSESRAHARARTLSASASLSMPPCLQVCRLRDEHR